MKRNHVRHYLHSKGVVLGDRLIVTERLRGGRTGQMVYTFEGIGTHALLLTTGSRPHMIRYAKIEDIETVPLF